MICSHCVTAVPLAERHDSHPGLCCDCFDLSFGMPLAALNRERADKGKQPITRPWPGLNENGDPI